MPPDPPSRHTFFARYYYPATILSPPQLKILYENLQCVLFNQLCVVWFTTTSHALRQYRRTGNFQERKLSRMILWLWAKVFSAKFGAWHLLAWQERAIRESFFHENCIFHKLVFSLESFPLYGKSGDVLSAIHTDQCVLFI